MKKLSDVLANATADLRKKQDEDFNAVVEEMRDEAKERRRSGATIGMADRSRNKVRADGLTDHQRDMDKLADEESS